MPIRNLGPCACCGNCACNAHFESCNVLVNIVKNNGSIQRIFQGEYNSLLYLAGEYCGESYYAVYAIREQDVTFGPNQAYVNDLVFTTRLNSGTILKFNVGAFTLSSSTFKYSGQYYDDGDLPDGSHNIEYDILERFSQPRCETTDEEITFENPDK